MVSRLQLRFGFGRFALTLQLDRAYIRFGARLGRDLGSAVRIEARDRLLLQVRFRLLPGSRCVERFLLRRHARFSRQPGLAFSPHVRVRLLLRGDDRCRAGLCLGLRLLFGCFACSRSRLGPRFHLSRVL